MAYSLAELRTTSICFILPRSLCCMWSNQEEHWITEHIRYIFCFHFLLKPPIGRGHRGVILSDGRRVLMLTQHAQRPGGAQLPFPAAAARQSERGLQRGENEHSQVINGLWDQLCVCVRGGGGGTGVLRTF